MKSSKNIVEEYLKQRDWRVKENSNNPFSLGGLNRYIIGEVSKDYWLREVYSEEIAQAYVKNYIHIHDLGGLTLYCCGYSLRDILLKGVRGVKNIPTSAPARHFDSVLNQISNLLTIYQNEIMGAVALNSFDTLLAPFIKNDQLTYNQVKQSMQNYIYSINSNSRMGAEPAFSNITFDLTPPGDLLDEYVIIGGELQSFTYRSCQKEMDMLNKAFFEIMLEGDSAGKLFSYPIPTYNIHKRFDWDNPNNKLLWKLTGKFGTPYFANYINSDMNPEDARSMALCGSQNVIFMDKNGRVTIDEIRHLVHTWIESGNQGYKMLMNGSFVDVVDMFEVPYENYDNFVSITLDNGYIQNFSEQHKCQTLRDNKIHTVESQDLNANDCFLISSKSWNIHNKIGDYSTGKIIGYYLGEGWKNTHSKSEICFAINIERDDIVNDIRDYFSKLGCDVNTDLQKEKNIYRISVYGMQAVGLVEQFISGNKATEKRLLSKIWNTCDDFRRGLYDGYLNTDGCPSHDIFAHTTNKKLALDLIILASSLGHILKYRENKINTRSFKTDKSDKVKFTSYELKIMDGNYQKLDGFYVVPIKEVNLVKSKTNTMYNFTVNSNEHLFELPNGIITHQCCRLRLDLTELRRRNGGLFGSGDSTGSIGVVTINLPRIAYENKMDEVAFYNALDNYLNIAKESLIIKRKWLQENIIDTNAIPAYMEYVGTLNNHFSTIGIIGMNEMCENFFEDHANIISNKGRSFAEEVGEHIRNKLVEFQEETGNLFNYEATPAESTAYRFALNDRKEYPDIITQGKGKDCYYTNSCHIPVKLIDGIDSTLKHQEKLQSQFTGGTVDHIMLEGSITGEQAKQIVKSMFTKYSIPYLSESPISRFCEDHGYILEKVDKCPICKKRLKKYQRITGYIRCVDDYNRGKRAEFEDRKQITEYDC